MSVLCGVCYLCANISDITCVTRFGLWYVVTYVSLSVICGVRSLCVHVSSVWYVYVCQCIWHLVCDVYYMCPCVWHLVCDVCYVCSCVWHLVCDVCYVCPCAWHLVCDVCYVCPCVWRLVYDVCYVCPCVWYLVCGGHVQDVHEEADSPTCLSILLSLMAKSRMFIKKLVTLPVYPSSCP